jgi:chromosome segregation ATPase
VNLSTDISRSLNENLKVKYESILLENENNINQMDNHINTQNEKLKEINNKIEAKTKELLEIETIIKEYEKRMSLKTDQSEDILSLNVMGIK